MKKTIHFISNTRLGGMITFLILLIAAILVTYHSPNKKDFDNVTFYVQMFTIGITLIAFILTPFTNKPWTTTKYLVKMKLSLGASVFIAQAMYDKLIAEYPNITEDVAKMVGHNNKLSYVEFLQYCQHNNLLDSDLCNHVKMRLLYEELIDAIKNYMHEHPDTN